jgi:outer membrane protein with beta-barrel domain
MLGTAVLAGLLTSAVHADAQIGVVAGAATSTIAFGPASGSPELTETERRTGWTAGVSFLLPTNRVGGWQIEAIVIGKGAENLLRRNDAMRLTYLEVPVLIHLDALRRGRSGVFLLAGPSVAFLVDASYEDEGVTEDIKDDLPQVDVGLHVGGGVELGPITVDARYIWGGRTLFHDGELDGTFKNRTFTVMAGIRFGR